MENSTNRRDTYTTCHCGASYNGSDHCAECGCEQFESGDCGHVARSRPAISTFIAAPMMGFSELRQHMIDQHGVPAEQLARIVDWDRLLRWHRDLAGHAIGQPNFHIHA